MRSNLQLFPRQNRSILNARFHEKIVAAALIFHKKILVAQHIVDHSVEIAAI